MEQALKSVLCFEGFCERLQQDGETKKLTAFTETYHKLKDDYVAQSIFVLDSVAYYLGIPVNDGSPEYAQFCVTGDRAKWRESREQRLKQGAHAKA